MAQNAMPWSLSKPDTCPWADAPPSNSRHRTWPLFRVHILGTCTHVG
uniref:Uncharacterized protein n=1 Tax=Rhizophora mucronata TaxID=61149 RepID=A0A2P2QCB1_RHIMU